SDQLGDLARGLACAGEEASEVAAVDVLQGQEGAAIVFADLEDLDDVGVLEPGHRLRLDPCAGQLGGPGVRPGQDHLEGDPAGQGALPGSIDNTHPAPADLALDHVAGWG